MAIDGTLRIGKLTGYPAGAASRSHCRVSVTFPENPVRLSPAVPGEEHLDFNYETTFPIDTQSATAYDKLIGEPLKVVLFSVSADTRHQTPAFEFLLYLDPLLTHRRTSICADLIGKHCEDGEFDASVTAPTLHLSFDIAEALLPPDAADGSAIMRLRVDELRSLPRALIVSTLHQDEKIHPFEYFVAFRFPGGRIIQLSAGTFTFGETPVVAWGGSSRVFLPAPTVTAILDEGAEVQVEIWRELSEDFSHFPIQDIAAPLVNGRARFPSADFTKPGQSHFASEIPVFKSKGEEPIRAPDIAPPPEEVDSKKGKAPAKKPSSRNAKRKPKRAVTAKDKKQFKVLATSFQELTAADGFDGRSLLIADLQFSHALVLKPLVPHPTVKPSDLIKRNEEVRAHRLQEATLEFRQAVQRLAAEILAAQKTRQDCQLAVPDFPDDLRPLLNRTQSYHVALEKLRIAVSYTFAEFSVAHAAQTEAQMQMLQSILPMYLHDELQKQLPEVFIPPRRPVNAREFLVKESDEAELMLRQTAATELLEELLAMDLADADAWWLYSCLMLRHGNVSRAEECVRRGLTCDPNHLKLSVLFASLLTRQEKYLDAIDFLNSAHFMDRIVEVILSILNGLANLPAKPILKDGESPLQFALELMEMMDVVFAEQLIAQEQMAKGETSEVLYMFGKLHYHLHDFSKAVSFLTRAVSGTAERTADALLLLGHVEFERGRYEEAAKWFDEGLEMRFEQGAALRLGFIYLKMKEYLKAEMILFQCSPQCASVLLGLAIAAMNMEKFKQADELLNRATVLNFRHPDIWAHLAILSHRMDRKEEAFHAAAIAKKWNLSDENLTQKLTELKLYGADEDYEAAAEEETEEHPPESDSDVEDE
jgi:tetratricopeptide (TPR) repeat protein